MIANPGKLYVLRPVQRPPDSYNTDLMGLASSLSFAQRREAHEGLRPSILVITSQPSRYRIEAFDAMAVNWVVVETPIEALDHLLNRGDICAAVLTDIELQGRDNGYRVVEAFRSCGYTGSILAITKREPLATERALVERRGGTATLVFGSPQMLHMLHAIAAGVMPTLMPRGPVSQPAPHSYPEWVSGVIKQLARFIGPSAGEAVRKLFVELHARSGKPPRPTDLVLEAADLLCEWPNDRACFIAVCRAPKAGAA